MASDYRVAAGSNVALAGLTVLNPQPSSQGVQATRRVDVADGSLYLQGLFCEFVWNVLDDGTQVRDIFLRFGLLTVRSGPVTIYTRDDIYNKHRYNGLAVRPPINWQNYFPRDMTILVKNLVELP